MNRKKLLKLLVILLLVLPLFSFILVNIGFLIYMYGFQDFDEMQMPEVNSNVGHIVLLAHGLRDTPESWSKPLQHILDRHQDEYQQVISLDWNPYSQNTFRCSVDGMRIGEKLAHLLNKQPSLQSLHLVGHSCGAFVVLGLCEAVKQRNSDIIIQATYLDPVAIYGGLFWDYGLEHFGSCADFSDAYIDTGDGVPGSNQLLPNASTFNITALRGLNGFKGNPHVWPTIYYQHLAESGKMLDYRKDKTLNKRYPQGILLDGSP